MNRIEKEYISTHFYGNETADEIKEALLHHKEAGRYVMTVINDVEIYNTSKDLEGDIKRAFQKLNESDHKKLQNLQEDVNRDYKVLNTLEEEDGEDTLFKYYFGLMRKLVEPEKLAAFEEYIYQDIYLYTGLYGYRILRFASSIVLIIGHSVVGSNDVYLEFNNLFGGLQGESQFNSFEKALEIVRNYTVWGEELDELMSRDLTSELKDRQKSKIKSKEQDIRNLFNQSGNDEE